MVCSNPYITQMAHPIFVGFNRLFPGMGHPRARMFDLIDADENGSISKFEMFEAVKAETVASTRLTFPFVCLVLGCLLEKTPWWNESSFVEFQGV